MKDKLLRIKELVENMILSREVESGGGISYDSFDDFKKYNINDPFNKDDFELHSLICELITSIPPDVRVGGADNG